ncbi:ABC transporter permease [uncultured Sneathia sp.]|uniref:ABC transporter permease n=1 Tax=uncultured Sneathia sp. TaxID=278067 RepID=UPI0028050FED|nr:ABC transporter permease [uncultured Sneathia sp.]
MNDLLIFISVIPESIKIGLIYSIMAMGVYITYKILDFPDLTVDGSFPLGGFVFAYFSLANVSPFLGLVFSLIAGALAGLLTSIFHIKCKIDKLLAGILTMITLYSINARIVDKPSFFVDADKTIYGLVSYDKHFILCIIISIGLLILKLLYDYNIKKNIYVIKSFVIYLIIFFVLTYYTYYTEDISMFITAIIVFIIKLIMDYILTSKFGFILRALGDNENIVTSLGVSSNKLKIIGLMISNSLVALSGALFTQYIRVIDLSSSVGTMVIGLASIIFGLGLIKKSRIINYISIVIVGSIVYYIIINFALTSAGLTESILTFFHVNEQMIANLSIKPTDVKIITALLLAIILGIDSKKKKVK